MSRIAFALVIALFTLLVPASAQDKKTPPKLKALLITGGGYHDYAKLNPVLKKKIEALAHVSIELKSGLDTLKNPNFADGYDIVLYNFCFAKDSNKDQLENALKVTREGKPTMMIHCAMHTFQSSDEWTDCCGMRTRVHDPYRAFSIIKADNTHPIGKTLPDKWPTTGDELYRTIRLGERSTALFKGKTEKGIDEHVVVWVSTYGKGKVFATTLGHDLKTVNMPEYHQLLANGLLWASDRMDKDGKPLPGYGASSGK
jgi:type 1 glutamine amidotransferase